MNELDVERILQQAIDTYGVEAQLDMCIEEMSELTKAICKYKRKGLGLIKPQDKVIQDLAEEAADVTIMLRQLNMMLQVEKFDFENKVNEIAEHKVKRLAERLGMNNEYCTMLNEEVEIIEEKQQGRWKPKFNEEYYYIHNEGSIIETIWLDHDGDNFRYLAKNIFKTEQEAEEYLEYKTALLEAEKPFKMGKENWKIIFNKTRKGLFIQEDFQTMSQGVIYLGQDEEVAQAFLDKWEKQILKYEFGIEE